MVASLCANKSYTLDARECLRKICESLLRNRQLTVFSATGRRKWHGASCLRNFVSITAYVRTLFYDLGEYLFGFRSKSFLWNLNECVEAKSKSYRCDAGLDEDSDNKGYEEDWHASDLQSHTILEDRGQIITNVSYKIGNFIASKGILKETRASKWVGQVFGTNKKMEILLCR